MKPLFYFFGIGRKEKIFAISDPIIIDNFNLSDLDEYSLERLFENKKLKLKIFIEEFTKDRGILFGVAKNPEKLIQFLKFGRLLSPDVLEKNFSIYFLVDEKCILFKINRVHYSWKTLKRDVWKIIESAKIISKKEFTRFTKDWKDYEYDPETFCFETSKFKLCVGKFYNSFICIKPKNYSQLKNKIKKAYKGQS